MEQTAIEIALESANRRNLQKVIKRGATLVCKSDGFSYAVKNEKNKRWYVNYWSKPDYFQWYTPRKHSTAIKVGLSILDKIATRIERKYENQQKCIY